MCGLWYPQERHPDISMPQAVGGWGHRAYYDFLKLEARSSPTTPIFPQR